MKERLNRWKQWAKQNLTPTSAQLTTILLATLIVISGSFLVISMKIQDENSAKAGTLPPLHFSHPFFQTLLMFYGELFCLIFSSDLLRKQCTKTVKRLKDRNRDVGKKACGKELDEGDLPEDSSLVEFKDADGVIEESCEKKREENQHVEKTLELEGKPRGGFRIHGANETAADETDTGMKLDVDVFLQSVESEDLLGEQHDSQKEEEENQLSNINPLFITIPAFFDTIGTTLMNFGLLLTFASVYQMMRGVGPVFNCVLSVIFLKQKRYFHHWFGIFLILLGLVVVGLFSYLNGSEEEAPSPLLGALMVLIAQIFTAGQLVSEEKIIRSKPNVNLIKIVGWEGFFGIFFTHSVLFVFYFVPGKDYGSFENFPRTLEQLPDNFLIFFLCFSVMICLVCFNICGIFITKRINSTARATINALKIVTIWIFQLLRKKEKFNFLEMIGFLILILGTAFYNEIVKIPFYHKWLEKRIEKKERLKKINEEVKDQSLLKTNCEKIDQNLPIE